MSIADAVASAREGLYPESIEADVSPARLARFFSKEDHSYRVVAGAARGGGLHGAGCAGRSAVLAPRPGLLPEPADLSAPGGAGEGPVAVSFRAARRRHPAARHLRNRWAAVDDRFETISKPERIYRHVGRSRPGESGFFRSASARACGRYPAGSGRAAITPDGPRRICANACCWTTYAPAAVLINRKHECLYSLGPDRPLSCVSPRAAQSQDLLAMARQGMRNKLRSAIQQASRDVRVAIHRRPGERGAALSRFSIAVQPVAATARSCCW